MMFMLPDDQARVKVLPECFATLTRHHLPRSRRVSEVASSCRDHRGRGAVGSAWQAEVVAAWKSSVMMPTMMRAFRGRAKATGALGTDVMEQAIPRNRTGISWYHRQRPVGAGRGLRSGADALPPGSVRRGACAGLPGGEQGTAGPVLQPVRLRGRPVRSRCSTDRRCGRCGVLRGRSAPRVVGAQPRRDDPRRSRAPESRLAANALLGHVQHPVQPHPARRVLRNPKAAEPIPTQSRSFSVALLAGQHQAEQRCDGRDPPPAPGDPCPRRVVLVNHPRPQPLRRDQRGRRDPARTPICGRAGRWERCLW